jgi:hypothetical protein
MNHREYDMCVIKSMLNAAIILSAPRLKKERDQLMPFLSNVPATSICIPEDDKFGMVAFRTDVPDPAFTGQHRDAESDLLSVQRLATSATRFTLSAADAERIVRVRAVEEVFPIGSVGSRVFAANAILAAMMDLDAIGASGKDSAGDRTFIGFVPALLTHNFYGCVSDLPEWTPNVLSNGGVARPLTFELLSNADRLIFMSKSVPWTHVLMTPGIVRRYQQFLTYGPDEKLLLWKGRPVIRHSGLPSGTVVLANMREIEVRRDASVDDLGKEIAPILGDCASGIGAYVTKVESHSDGVRCTMAIRAALGLKSRRSHALICDIAEE